MQVCRNDPPDEENRELSIDFTLSLHELKDFEELAFLEDLNSYGENDYDGARFYD